MDFVLFLKGLLIGLAVSIPLGPMGMVCVTRTLNHGRYSGFFSGLGAATADTIFALIAGFGISYIINFIQEKELAFQMAGGSLVIFFGLRIFRTNPVNLIRKKNISRNKLIRDFFSVLLITLTNPMAIFLFLAVFAASNIVLDPTSILKNLVLFTGVFAGASLWWFLLSSVVYTLRYRLKLRSLVWLNRITGGLLLFLGVAAIFNLFLTYFQ